MDLIIIGGATASGKSDCAVALSRHMGGEVVSCDSMQLYRGMDIGTATPTEAEMGGVPHHLMSILDPNEPFSAAAYRARALPVIEDILGRGKVPILCGGTGLYINALTRPLSFARKGDEGIRAQLNAILESPNGKAALHGMLQAVDPDSAARLHENDVRRVMRALEIYRLTGRTLTAQIAEDASRPGDYTARLFAIDWPRDVLYARIDARVDQMIARGLLDEVKALVARGVPKSATALQAIGYKELIGALEGRATLAEAIEAVKMSSRRYAKRQLTWFRNDPRTRWIAADGRGADAIAREIFSMLKGETA